MIVKLVLNPNFWIIVFHAIGIVGYIHPDLRPYFILLTPFQLSFFLLIILFIFYKNTLLKIFFYSYCVGFLAEIIGIWTGFPFGQYQYGETLGVKVLEVPLVIGINWFLMAFCFFHICHGVKDRFWKIMLSSAGMTAFDFIIEPVAIRFDYWSWQNVDVPISNYLGWFFVSVIIQWAMHQWYHSPYKKEANFAKVMIISQFVFFFFLNIFILFEN